MRLMCKACNNIMSELELLIDDELCKICLNSIYESEEKIMTHRFMMNPLIDEDGNIDSDFDAYLDSLYPNTLDNFDEDEIE